MSPYSKRLEKITDVSPYFRYNNNDSSMTFIGESLEVRIPSKFDRHGALTISQSVTTLGVADLVIDDKYHVALNLLASITMIPTDISSMTYKGIEYTILHLSKGDTFMTSTKVIQDQHVVYVLWSEFITAGNVPYWMSYANLLALFEHVRELTGGGIGVSRSVFEGIVAHISRDKDQVMKPYRLTDMKKPVNFIALNSISQSTSSAIAKVNGAYFKNEGMVSALRYQVDEQQPFENILRGVVPARNNDSLSSAEQS